VVSFERHVAATPDGAGQIRSVRSGQPSSPAARRVEVAMRACSLIRGTSLVDDGRAKTTGVCKAFGMASLIWLIVWLVKGTPDLEWFGTWNDWAVALLACVVFDLFSGREAGRASRH
jgi:hypothetical protein